MLQNQSEFKSIESVNSECDTLNDLKHSSKSENNAPAVCEKVKNEQISDEIGQDISKRTTALTTSIAVENKGIYNKLAQIMHPHSIQ